ncbi:hypothetical protein DPMN_104478 [Dreissena polymorpha]|uniref:Uncharacterized protein n=1 Tax=Dreissena polymorpha TaxID=45954 RepID=A0A9D4K165_DREPO|nr:hypothetical protein DPMN_104478 [Dreissena polymorpha]
MYGQTLTETDTEERSSVREIHDMYARAIFGRAMYTQLLDHLENIFNPMLSAFRPGQRCSTTLLKIAEDWKRALDEDNYLATVLMDLSKAFDFPIVQSSSTPHKRTNAERARPRQHAHTVPPEPPTAKTSRDKRTLIHPLAAHDNRSVNGRPRSLTKPHPESSSPKPDRLPNIKAVYKTGLFLLYMYIIIY